MSDADDENYSNEENNGDHRDDVEMSEFSTYNGDKNFDLDTSTELETINPLDLDMSNSELSEVNSDEQIQEEKKSPIKLEATKVNRLPLGRIKNIMKVDPDANKITADAVFLVTKATELFLETMVNETVAVTKKKVISRKDLDHVIETVDCLCFLEGAMDF